MTEDEIAAHVVDASVAIHRVLGPGLLESAYLAALEIELVERELRFDREVPIHAYYRDKPLGVVYRADLVVDAKLLVEVKSVKAIEDIHVAQILSYLRLGDFRLGLLLNFNVPTMRRGIKRVVNNL